MIWRMRPTSPRNISWHFGSTRTISSRSFSLARVDTSVATSSIASARLNGAEVEHELAGVDLREIEDVVDDGEQRVARLDDDVGEHLLLRRQLGFCQQLGHAEHAVHRRADLVAHIGEEFGLGAVGEHRLALRFLELLLAFLELGDVGRRADQIERAVGRGHRRSCERSGSAASRRAGRDVSAISCVPSSRARRGRLP